MRLNSFRTNKNRNYLSCMLLKANLRSKLSVQSGVLCPGERAYNSYPHDDVGRVIYVNEYIWLYQ